jgi:hypothetical protein
LKPPDGTVEEEDRTNGFFSGLELAVVSGVATDGELPGDSKKSDDLDFESGVLISAAS